jgi:methionyl-tRNA synthetase
MNSAAFSSYLAAHLWIIILAILWTLPWKGVALWKAARNQSVVWFIAIFILNTLGIVEIIYIFFFSEKKGPLVDIATDTSLAERKII